MLGHAPLYPGQEGILCQPGPMARSAADLSLAMAVLAASPEKITDPTLPPVPFHGPQGAFPKGLRIGFYTDNGLITPAPALRRAVLEAGGALRSIGAVVEAWAPPDPSEAFRSHSVSISRMEWPEFGVFFTGADGIGGFIESHKWPVFPIYF